MKDSTATNDPKSSLRELFLAGIAAVDPERLLLANVKRIEGQIHVCDQVYNLNAYTNIIVMGAGKASGQMAAALESVLGERISKGLVIVKHGHASPSQFITIREAGHPVPDAAAFSATRELLHLVEGVSPTDLVIGLWSGGGSSLLADGPGGVPDEAMVGLNALLVSSGAGIDEINAVRKHLSGIKGGQLARKVYPATMVNLLLSDVPGDSPAVIASGPTCPDPSGFVDAWEVVHKYKLASAIYPDLLRVLAAGVAGQLPETPKPGDPVFDRVSNHIIGSNRIALKAIAAAAGKAGLLVVKDDLDLHGDTVAMAEAIVPEAKRLQTDPSVRKPCCWIMGGETTLRVGGPGRGGRNQHMALVMAKLLAGTSGITVLSAGSDGTDGPTDAAGAVADGRTFPDAHAKGIDGEAAIGDFDAYHFFSNAGGHIITGPTRTNVMDIVIILVE
ncbi:DUF4147 domain-containing protein [Flavihumibacter rivuli]|uniref:glycerate kinase type-2 family protein n=1 Tax=Flavihumibacter rivuli TaxID=2838156 RepID=UPI001BDEAC36|nr:DUF4147 domain-containing protein [Flavihumibacter rivuli]ULQ55793.1 DUF4147 domain-containing protein [Flavihumibacter rivuli]